VSSHGVVDRSSQVNFVLEPLTMSDKLKPGQQAPASGQYAIVGPRGGDTGRERTVVQGESLPPTPQAGQRYQLVDPTRNGAGKPKK
jgi:hypothetical protein